MIPGLPSSHSINRSPETLWSRAIIAFGMVLFVSFGLCGLNFFAVLGLNGAVHGTQNAPIRQTISRTLIGFGYVEVFGMIIGIVGVVVSLVGAGISALLRRREPQG